MQIKTSNSDSTIKKLEEIMPLLNQTTIGSNYIQPDPIVNKIDQKKLHNSDDDDEMPVTNAETHSRKSYKLKLKKIKKSKSSKSISSSSSNYNSHHSYHHSNHQETGFSDSDKN